MNPRQNQPSPAARYPLPPSLWLFSAHFSICGLADCTIWAQSVDNVVYQPCTVHGLSVRNRLPTLRPHCDFANPLPRYCVVGCSLTPLHTCTSTSTPLMHVRSSIPFIREPRVFFSRERSSVCVSLSHSFDSPSTIPSPQVVRKKSIVALLLLKRSSCLGERARGREGRGDRLATRIYVLRRESGGGLGVTGATNGEPRAGLTSLRCSIFRRSEVFAEVTLTYDRICIGESRGKVVDVLVMHTLSLSKHAWIER